jgi:hypothetical protein
VKIKWNYKKNKHQQEFHEELNFNRLHLSTGFGGGKSYALIMKMVQLSWINRNMPGGFMCPTYRDFMRDIHPMIEEIMIANNIQYQFHKTEHWYRFPWSEGRIYVVSGDTKVRGPNWAFGLINEVTLIPFDRYQDFIGRVRVKKSVKPMVASCGTPEGVITKYYDYFVEKPSAQTKVIYGSTLDNLENLNETYVTSLQSAYDNKALEAYMHGKFVNMNGKQFYYAFNSAKNEDKSIAYDDAWPIHCFMDFNVSPMVATFWQYKFYKGQNRLCGFDEIVIPDGANTDLMVDAMIARQYFPSITTIYPDPAGKARSTKGAPDVEILQRRGFYNIKVKSKAPLVRTRQLNVNNLLEKGFLVFNPTTMPYMRKDLLLVEQDVVTLEKVKKNQELTHASDGLDYGCDILCPFSGQRPNNSGVFKFR